MDGEGYGPRCRCGPFQVRFFPPGLLRPLLLRLLVEGPRTGFALIHEVTARTDRRWTPGPAAIYPALRELAEAGYIRRAPGGPGLPRAYSLTPKGRKVASDWDRMKESGRDELQFLIQVWEHI